MICVFQRACRMPIRREEPGDAVLEGEGLEWVERQGTVV